MATRERNTVRLQQPYERFQAWVAAHELALRVYHLTRTWPAQERWGLVSQARRRRFLGLSLGSLAELSYIFRLARDLGYMRADEGTELEILRDHTHRLTWGLYRAVSNRVRKT